MFIKEGDGSPNVVREELHSLEIRREELQREMAAGQANPQVLYHPGMADLYRRKVGELQTLLMSAESRTQAMELIRSLIECIKLGFPMLEPIHAGKRAKIVPDWQAACC